MISAAEARVISSRKRNVDEIANWVYKQIRKAANSGDTQLKVYLDDLFSRFKFDTPSDMTPVLQQLNMQLQQMGYSTKAYKNKLVIIWGNLYDSLDDRH